jgi:Uma2 family endonuclease
MGVHRAVAMGTRRGYVAGMSETTLMTAEELLRLNLPDKRTELIRGRLVVRDPGGARHGAVAMRLGYRIMAHVEAHDLGRVYAAETGFKIESAPDTVRAPDVAFIAKHRVPEVEPRGYPGWAPDLAVEVLAHDDHPAETLEKIAQWLKAGVRLVWVVDSEKRTGRIYRADGSEALLGPNDVLDGEDMLPGFGCPLANLW